ncbi:hypothetical protein TNCT_228801 [Trichonephila clavata]|uniref:Uncharacterized protein n=1 Tax=Trichonephila clavata TaxID=2740835 RepID=A0A8X6LN94_TRICU|nr:hypothetical protein TNCT_228801 [Trichonephila clavata]
MNDKRSNTIASAGFDVPSVAFGSSKGTFVKFRSIPSSLWPPPAQSIAPCACSEPCDNEPKKEKRKSYKLVIESDFECFCGDEEDVSKRDGHTCVGWDREDGGRTPSPPSRFMFVGWTSPPAIILHGEGS